MKNKKPLYPALLEFFDSGWFMSQNDEKQFVRVLYDGTKGGNWVAYAQAEGETIFTFFSMWPDPIAEEKRLAMSELLTRINYGLKIGNFEMDWDDGELRYKTGIMLEDKDWREEVIRPVVFYNLHTMDDYWPSLKALVEGKSPTEAFALTASL